MNGWVTIGVKADTKTFEKQIEKTKNQLEELQDILSHKGDKLFSGIDFEKVEIDAEKLRNKLIQLEKQEEKVKNPPGNNSFLNGLKTIKNETESITKKVIKWGLAVFGIRSAYRFFLSSVNTLSQYNEQLGTDIQYIRFALATTLEPVILRIVSLVKTLLAYINYIAKAWFGVDLFAGASVDKFKQNEKSLGKAAKSAKEINKQLAGFDEMNVLQDNTDKGGGAGGGGDTLPSIDFSKWDGKVPAWLQWIADNKDIIIAGLLGIAGALTAIKLGADLLTGIGIGIVLAGIVLLVKDIIDFIKDPSWTKFLDILRDISIIALGIGVIIGAWPVVIIAAIALIVVEIIKNWNKIKEILGKVWQYVKEKTIDPLIEQFELLWNAITTAFTMAWEFIKNILDGVWQYVKEKTIDPLVEQFKLLWDAIKTSFTMTWNFIVGILQGIASWVKNTIVTPIANFFKGLWDNIKSGVKGTYDKVTSTFSNIVDFFKNIVSRIVDKFRDLGGKVGDTIGSAFKKAINAVLSGIEKILNTPIRAINGLISAINSIPGVSMSKLSTFSLPRLAKGGIINNPGKGVMVGSAIVGERGAEGVIPLTDSQQMQLLGEAIGKYITVNANIVNTMNGRVISRELQKVQNESDFAFNR